MASDEQMDAYGNVLKQQMELLKKAKSRKGQRATQANKRSRTQLEQEFSSAALDAKMQNLMLRHQTRHMLRSTFISEAYLPCVQPLSSLDPILLRDLKLETHHRGRVLIVRMFCEPSKMSSIMNAIEDVSGGVDRLSVYNLPSHTPPSKVLPRNAIAAVKEPYYKVTADRGVMVRVDHPSDLVLLKPIDSMVPTKWKQEEKAPLTAAQLKDKGNAAFKNRDWEDASRLYSEALVIIDDDEDLRFTLYRNRSQARLQLGQYEFAVEDAKSSIIPGDHLSEQSKALNLKSLFRAGRAYYALGDFTLAKDFFEKAVKLGIKDDSLLRELDRTEKRVLEQDKGQYDFVAMAASATESHTRLDHASFLCNTKVAPAGHRGRGLFATKDIKHGEIILVEKAFYAAFEDKDGHESTMLMDINTNYMSFGTQAERLYGALDKMRSNPRQAAKYLDLFGGPRFKVKEATVLDGAVIIDTFQAQAIAQFNGFECARVKSNRDRKEKERGLGGSTGIWLHASYINHSCILNASRTFIGDMMIIRATRDIRAGEEIFMAYWSPVISSAERKKKISFYQFDCDCPVCKADRQVPASILRRRDELIKSAQQFIAGNPQNQASFSRPTPPAKISQANDLRTKLEATYGEQLYGDLPRLGCVDLDLWLCQTADSPAAGITTTTRLLQSLGYRVRVRGADLTIERAAGVMLPPTLHGAMYAAQAWAAAGGRREVVAAFVEFAREAYLAMYGELAGFEEDFGPTTF